MMKKTPEEIEIKYYLKNKGGKEGRVVVRRNSLYRSSVETHKPDKLLISIIILTCNQIEYTKLCLESIRVFTNEPYELICVDNGSTDGTPDYLEEIQRSKFEDQNLDCKDLRIIKNKENCGFARGCNQGIETARGNYILLLNNDVIVSPGWLSGLINHMQDEPDAGIVGPMSNYGNGPQRDERANYSTIEDFIKYAQKISADNGGQRIEFCRISGFCMLINRAVINAVGLLDTRFGIGNYEDDDFCLRAWQAGFKLMIAKDVFIHHFGGRTFVGNGIDPAIQSEKNLPIFLAKWSSKPQSD